MNNLRFANKIKLLLIVLTIFPFSLTILNFTANYPVNTKLNEDNAKNINFPKVTSPSISISTPENKTYSAPMSGFYPATYSFENDEIGTYPKEWEVQLPSGTSLQVISELGGHKNVVEFYDNNGGDHPIMRNTIIPQLSGVIEFFMRTSNAYEGNVLYLANPGYSANAVNLRIRYDTIEVDNGGWQTILDPALDNTWYHIRVDFDCGLDTFDVYIDGELKLSSGSFIHNVASIGGIVFNSGILATGHYMYIDAVGSSSDPNYSIGDNTNEGILVSFDTIFTPDWLGSSLDGLENKTILGNKTIPIPSEGIHSIQIFGNDTIGTIYKSEIRYFSVKFINIITPKNKTYTLPMSGYFPATYGCEDVIDGQLPATWSDTSDPGSTVGIVTEKLGHKKVIHCSDDDGGGASRLSHEFPDKSYGTIEYWVLMEDCTGGGRLWVRDDDLGEQRFVVGILNDKWMYSDGANHKIAAFDGSYDPIDNTWYHISIHFRGEGAPNYQGLAENRFKIVVDGLESEEIDFMNNGSVVDYLWFRTSLVSTLDVWYDAIGFSWDLNYNIGDNRYEGLLISFKKGFGSDWLGYSLDKQGNNTIPGNKTIPIPSEGIHTIQIFGNNTLGINYKSEIRYFTIDLLPLIFIHSPKQNSVFGLNAPNFNITIVESFLNETWYSLDNGLTNIFFTGLTGTIDQAEWDKQPDGQITIRFYANDSIGQENFKDLTIIKDTAAPIILINSPLENEKYTYIAPSFNISITDVSLSETWYTLDNGLTNITFLGLTGSINQTEWDNQPDGSVTLRFYAKDRIDLMNFEEIIILKDTILPTVSIITPEDDEIFAETPPSFNISINDTNLDKTWYTLDNGITNITFSGLTGTINQTEWDKQADGLVIIKFYANDTFGLENFDEFIVFKDTTAPIITIISPLADGFHSTTPPSFSISITDPYLNSSWYTLDGGVTNITFSDLTSIISQTEWDKQAEGLVTIRFYANDLLGHINYGEVTIYKDTIDPLIIIHFPSAGDTFTVTPPRFNVTITDLNLESMWYTIDGGLNNYYIDKSTGFIDSTAWNAALIGAVTIRFYARDLAGNVEYIDVVVQKNPTPSPPNMNLIIIAVSLISVTALLVLGIIAYRRGYVRIKKPKTLSDEGRKTEPKKLRREKRRKKSKIEPRIISCPFCQNKILSDQKYCKFCGANLRT